MRTLMLSLALSSLIGSVVAQDGKQRFTPRESTTQEVKNSPREMVLGGILKGALENMHFSRKKIDDDISQKAYKLFIERLDYGKQFFVQHDLDDLAKYKKSFDDEMISGNLEALDRSYDILKQRVNYVENIVLKRLDKPFDLSREFTIETDPKKRKPLKSIKELDEFWEKQINYEVLQKYAELKDEQEGLSELNTSKRKKKKEKEKKEKSEKKLTEAELEVKAREGVKKSYTRIFARLKTDKRGNQIENFFNSITRVFDPHSNYLIPEDKEDFDMDMSGKLEGIGALLREDGSYIKVEKIIPGSPSWKQKELKEEDVILKVGQGDKEAVDVVDMSINDAVKLIRGKKGSTVKLTVKKPNGLIKEIPITRDVVELEDSYAKSVILKHKDQKQKYGYIYLPKFYRDFNDRNGRNVTEDTRKAIAKVKKSGVDGIILDLRNNGGGALDDARMISGLFIEKGPIVQVKAHTGKVDILADDDSSVEFDKPVVVLINQYSASASEIVAAALQDYKRAIVIGGAHSHGKGTVQAVVDLDPYVPPMARAYTPMGALKITIQKFYRVTGGSTQYEGVTPDIVLPELYDFLETGEKYLDYSLPWAKVDAVKFTPWNKFNYDLKTLSANTAKRVSENPNFKKMVDLNAWSKERKDRSLKTYSLKKYLAERDELRKKSEEFEIKDKNLNVVVESTDKLKTKDEEERFSEYTEELQKDPYIDEALYVLEDTKVK